MWNMQIYFFFFFFPVTPWLMGWSSQHTSELLWDICRGNVQQAFTNMYIICACKSMHKYLSFNIIKLQKLMKLNKNA